MTAIERPRQFETTGTGSVDIVVENRTGLPIRAVTVFHERGGAWSGHTWEGLAPDGSDGGMVVPLHLLDRGCDRWMVAWADSSGGHLTVTCARNCPHVPDAVAAVAPLIGHIAGTAAAQAMPWGKSIGSWIIAGLARSPKTVGFTHHFLRPEEAGGTTRIVLGEDAVEWHSRAGTTTTGTTQLPLL